MTESLLDIASDPRKLGVAEHWFKRVAHEVELTARDKRDLAYDVQRVGTTVLREAIALGNEVGKKYRADTAVYKEIMNRRNARNFPESLRQREPGSPLYVVAAHFPIHATLEKYDNIIVDPLVRVLRGEVRQAYIYGHCRVNEPNRTEELEADGIHFLDIDEDHFKVVKESRWNPKLKQDAYSADTLVALFGLTEAEHGQGEVVVLVDRRAGQTMDAMAEAVKTRIGKYPHIGTEIPAQDIEDHASWQVFEYVPQPLEPDPPSLSAVLGEMALASQ